MFKGILIGAANIIPGLSGSTLALILGIYEKTITIITKFDLRAIQLIKEGQFRNLKIHISFNFLFALIIGIIISVISLAHLLNYLFQNFETYTWSYFFGIILASIFYVSRYTSEWNIIEFLCLFVGVIISCTFFLLNPNMEENSNLLFVFTCGIIGVTGMLIPGLSGSYLLVLLGNYKLLISDTLHYLTQPKYYNSDEFDEYLKLGITFLIGHIFGLLLFSRLIKWLLTNYNNQTFSTLTGFIIGSLVWIWPWKQTNTNESSLSLLQQLSYPDFNKLDDLYAILIMFLGFMTIIILEKLAKKYKNV